MCDSLKVVLFVCLSILCIGTAEAQVSYSYDLNGNRTARVIVLNTLKSDELVDCESKEEGESFRFDDQIGSNSVRIYPNPTKGQLRVDINEESEIIGNIVIVNGIGKTVERIMSVSTTNFLDLSKQPQGIYMMQININGENRTWKIIKE